MPKQVQKIVQIALTDDENGADIVYALDNVGQVWCGHWVMDGFDWGAPLPPLPDQAPPDGEA